MTELIIGIPIIVLLLFIIFEIGKLIGTKELYNKILKNNQDYFLTEDLKIEKIWSVPE